MYRWVCFEENYSMITKFQPFPHSVFRMGVSQVCQFFQFYVWKFCRFQIAHLRRFRACYRQSSTTCGAIDDRRISLKAIDERVFTKFRDKKCRIYKFVQQKCRIYPFSRQKCRIRTFFVSKIFGFIDM